jgi:hypothetical protein
VSIFEPITFTKYAKCVCNGRFLIYYSTLTEALERSKRKYQSKIKKLEQQLFRGKADGDKDEKSSKIEK